ncbi:MAG: MbnP family protein [Bacteroidota bacterium]
MKNNQSGIYNSVSVIIAFLMLSISACKKDNTSSTASTGTFYIHLHTNIDTNEVASKTALYRDSSGRHFSLSTAQFYISNIMLHNVTGSMYTFSGVTIIKNIDSEAYLVGQAPVGTYDYVMFDVGLDSATNALSPTAFSPIGYISSSSMWYGCSSQGYQFMKLIGTADTTAAQNGTNLVNFSYEIGSSANLKSIKMPVRSGSYAPYILTKGGNQYIHVICDYGALLSVVDFRTQDSSNTYGVNPTLSSSIANNFVKMFRYEE